MGIHFAEVEKRFYFDRYFDFCEGQHERNRRTGHSERDRTTDDLLQSKKTAPEESIIQIGTMEDHIPYETLLQITCEFFTEFTRRFGEHVHILDWSLHLDEATPHIHERHVFDCENQYGEIAPQQEKALEVLGIPLSFPDKPPSKTNNRKITFDGICREILFEVARKHGVQLDHEPEYGGRAYLEKQDYILMKQKQKIAQQTEKLDELTMKLEDVENLIDEVTDIAYEKAVDAVTEEVIAETQNRQIAVIEDFQKWALSSERKASRKEQEFTSGLLGKVIRVLQSAATKIAVAVRKRLLKKEVKEKHTRQIKQEAKQSILDVLRRSNPAAARIGAEKKQKDFEH